MKRIHLFEFEDFPWFPDFLRIGMTRYLNTFHKIMDTPHLLAEILDKGLKKTDQNTIIDMCSGGGGPMEVTRDILEKEYGHKDLKLTLTDLYPNTKEAARINALNDPKLEYITQSIDATHIQKERKGLRTMICSLHHIRPSLAKAILKDAQDNKQPYCAYEISDNSAPAFLWWSAIPFAFIIVFFVTPFVRPLSWKQLFFTYIIPLIPFFIAWDGAVSNARTYTLSDLDELTKDLQSDDYTWEKGTIKGKGGNKIYLLGYPN